MSELPFEGRSLRLGGRDWIVPALNLRQLKALAPKFALLRQVTAEMGGEQIDALVEIAHAALSRNYPSLGRDEVAELVDLRNARLVVDAIVGASGLKPGQELRGSENGAPAGEPPSGETPLGEAGAGRPSTASTGTN